MAVLCCRVALVVAGAVLAAFPPTGHTGGFALAEMGARRTGMGAAVGRPDEPAAVLHNPAGLTLLPGTRIYLSFGLSLVDTSFKLSPWPESDRFIDEPVDADGYYPEVEPERAFAVLPMLVGSTELVARRLWVAAALYVGNATGSSFDENASTRYHLIDGYVVAPLGSLSVAYRPTDGLAAGLGFGVMNIRVHGRRNLYPIVSGMDLSGLLGPSTELVIDGSDWVPTWNAGLLFTPHPRVTLGVDIIGRTDAEIAGPIEVNFEGDVVRWNGDQTTELLLPWTFQAGANVDVHPKLELGAELRYWLYRQYDRQRIDVDGIPLVDEIISEKDYRDSWQVSGGGRLHDLAAAPGLEAMLGFHYDRTPAPARTVSLDQPSFSHFGLHGGGRYQLGRYRVGLTYIRYWYRIPTITDSVTMPPSNITGSGVNNIVTLSLEATLGRLVDL